VCPAARKAISYHFICNSRQREGRISIMITLHLLLAAGAIAAAEPTEFKSWTFDAWNDQQGWSVPPVFGGAVAGGGLWLHIQMLPKHAQQLSWRELIWLPHPPPSLVSPSGLGIDATRATKVRLRLLNRSPETDGLLIWRTAAAPDTNAGTVRFTMQPMCDKWQDVVIDMENRWAGVVDQLHILPALIGSSGDMWISRIAVTDGAPAPARPRPDVASAAVVPKVTLPGIDQAGFADAFKVLDECLISNVPVHGFTEPVMGPGGAYGENWWQLDSSLACDGAKWANQSFAEGVLRGFRSVQSQNPDGRIDLWGGSPSRGMPALASSIPRLFEVGYRIARRSTDDEVRRLAFEVLGKYLDWWLSPVKRDAKTGLITYAFEETFCEPVDTPQTMAPVDLQVAVAIGCAYVADLARWVGEEEAATRFQKAFEDMKEAINKYCWDEGDGAYYNFNVKTMTRSKRLIVSTFDPLRLGIAPKERVPRLLKKLTDPALFNWGNRPLTSLAKTERDYVEAEGPYDGRAWLGDIWTMRNLPVIFGLRDCGHDDLAARLAWDTVKVFHANYFEYVTPSKGKGEGVARYGWSASLYIQTVIEHLFGIDYDAVAKRLTVGPLLVPELRATRIAIEGLRLPTQEDSRMSISIVPRENAETEFEVVVSAVPKGVLLVIRFDGMAREMPLASEQRVVFKRR
jgi:hypothetical protein